MKVYFKDLIDTAAYIDPAAGKKQGVEKVKRTRARSAIVLVGQDLLRRIFVLYTWAARCSTDELIDQIFEMYEKFHPRIVGGEAAGLQSLFQDAVIREAKYKRIHIPLVPIPLPTNIDKDWRIRMHLQKPWSEGRVFFQKHQVELFSEVQGFPRYNLKDLIDALSMAISLLPDHPIVQQQRDEVQGLAAHLRELGTDPEEILRRVREFQFELEQDSLLRADGRGHLHGAGDGGL